ncbi:BatA domain-containing protein [Hymenobacter sediminis]|uniref:BatA domain-containing protein n=1 Tax=Hymenobacter sediminis TaxID=2218621 RepID=UPI001EE3E0F3|nr:BatA domain-containing protein [Hymenobacter sediminis]
MAFTYPWFLAALLAISIPIAVHLFELRRPQRLLFSNVEFIKEVKLVTARQRRLKHWLILAVRIGLISFLVLLFAQPFIPAPEGADKADSVVSVLVDSSPSMQQLGGEDAALLEQAIQEAQELPLAFPAATRYALLPHSRNKALNAAEYRAEIEQIQVSGQSSKLIQEPASNNQQSEGPLFVFSDYQRNVFSKKTLAELDTSRQTFLVPLEAQRKPNVFIDSIWLDDAFIRQGVDVQAHIRLRNGGQEAAENCQAKLFVGERQVASFQTAVPAQQAVTTQVRVRLTVPGVQQCRIVVEDFPVGFDNTYYFTLRPATQISIVEVADSKQLDQLYSNEPLFTYHYATPRSVDYKVITKANLVIVREATALSAGLQDALREATEHGATVVIIPSGTASSRETYARLFRGLGLGPIQWNAQQSVAPPLQEVAMPSTQNPFFKEVFAGVNQRVAMPKAAPVLRWSRSGAEILQLRDGEGYLGGFPSGKGMVYVFAAPLSLPYSDFGQHALFVPVMYRLAMLSYQQEQQPAYRLNQQSVTLQLPDEVGPAKGKEAIYRLVQDSLAYIPTQRQQGSILHLDLPSGMQKPGFYSLQRDGQTVATLAFNFDKRESDLRSYSTAELRELIGPDRPNVHVYDLEQGQTVAARYKATRVGVPLWRYCLLGALLCLFLEGLLIRLNRGTAAAPLAEAA